MPESWKVDGTYMEACNCKSACPCVFLSPPTEGECTALVGWHIATGNYGHLKLDGLNVAAAIHSPGTMVESKWRIALYLDDRASEDQKDALLKIFSGQAGGHPKVLADQIGEVLGIKTVPLEFHSEGKRYSLRVGDIGRAETETVAGQNDSEVMISNPPLAVAPGFPSVCDKSTEVKYRDYGYDWTISERNGFHSRFMYQAS
ncbi:MAG TPA: DUF1326 domain-containing protein [Bryobacteraceae bacterium]|jgi:hypothetical protein|nr:DUF1326 domain-containing protein [Bryobacteraceae bacterium]